MLRPHEARSCLGDLDPNAHLRITGTASVTGKRPQETRNEAPENPIERTTDMKRILTASALILAGIAASTASAMAAELTGTDRAEVLRLVPGADIDTLSSGDVNAIKGILHGDDRNRGGQIRAILN